MFIVPPSPNPCQAAGRTPCRVSGGSGAPLRDPFACSELRRPSVPEEESAPGHARARPPGSRDAASRNRTASRSAGSSGKRPLPAPSRSSATRAYGSLGSRSRRTLSAPARPPVRSAAQAARPRPRVPRCAPGSTRSSPPRPRRPNSCAPRAIEFGRRASRRGLQRSFRLGDASRPGSCGPARALGPAAACKPSTGRRRLGAQPSSRPRPAGFAARLPRFRVARPLARRNIRSQATPLRPGLQTGRTHRRRNPVGYEPRLPGRGRARQPLPARHGTEPGPAARAPRQAVRRRFRSTRERFPGPVRRRSRGGARPRGAGRDPLDARCRAGFACAPAHAWSGGRNRRPGLADLGRPRGPCRSLPRRRSPRPRRLASRRGHPRQPPADDRLDRRRPLDRLADRHPANSTGHPGFGTICQSSYRLCTRRHRPGSRSVCRSLSSWPARAIPVRVPSKRSFPDPAALYGGQRRALSAPRPGPRRPRAAPLPAARHRHLMQAPSQAAHPPSNGPGVCSPTRRALPGPHRGSPGPLWRQSPRSPPPGAAPSPWRWVVLIPARRPVPRVGISSPPSGTPCPRTAAVGRWRCSTAPRALRACAARCGLGGQWHSFSGGGRHCR